MRSLFHPMFKTVSPTPHLEISIPLNSQPKPRGLLNNVLNGEARAQGSSPYPPVPWCTLFTPQNFCTTFDFFISPGYYSRPKRNWKQWLRKISGNIHGALWEMCKWRLPFLTGGYPLSNTLYWRIVPLLNT